jgi:methionyl-tRNA synthetase
MSNAFFVTTPIYYPNGVPHIGNAYASIIADVLARYHRQKGDTVRFSTGVDENSQKIVDKAAELGLPVMEYLDQMAVEHRRVWDGIDISYTDFVRTTSPSHAAFVQSVLQKSFDNGDIYEGVYEGMYCRGCEGFKKATDLTPAGKCPDHPTQEVEHLKEKNYFFRLSRYTEQLQAFYAANPHFVTPQNRFNEVLEFVNQGLEDFSVSRETNKFGIPLPFDGSQVTYVWYDALFNYISTLGDEADTFWPAQVHVVAKDIIRFHAIFWPAMLLSAGYALPGNIVTTGYFTIDGQKISKSLGNVIDPVEYAAKYSRDLLVNYLLTTIPIGQDGDFSEKESVLAFNNRLANTLGNLLNRCLVLTLKNGGTIAVHPYQSDLAAAREALLLTYERAFAAFDLRGALIATYEFAESLNKYIDTVRPWELVDVDPAKLEDVMYQVAESLRTMAILLHPFFSPKMEELLSRIGVPKDVVLMKNGNMGAALERKTGFSVLEKGEPLYMRISL